MPKKTNKMLLATAIFTLLAGGNAIAAGGKTRDINVESVPMNESSKVEIDLRVADGRDTVAIGDTTSFCFTASASGYLSLWDFGTSGKIKRIYPYPGDDNFNRVQPGREECVGDSKSGKIFRINGPEGIETVYAFWTQNEEDQIKAANFRSSSDFAAGIARKAKDINVENTGGWENWATAMVTFRIGEDYSYNGSNYYNGNNNDHNNGSNDSNGSNNIIINELVQTIGNYNNIYIVAFGSNVDQLKKTNDDAELFIQMMRTTLDVPAQNTRLYKDALYSDFEEGFEWLSDNAKANDLVLFYYSGHGTTLPDDNNDEGAGADGLDEAIVPYDYTKMSFDDASKYIRDDQLKEWFDNIQASSIVTVFDSCFSGGMYKSFSQGGMLNARPKFLTKGKIAGKLPQYRGKSANKKDIGSIDSEIASGNNKRVLIAASKEKQYALEIPGSGGALTVGLLEALQNKGGAEDWQGMSELTKRNVERDTDGMQNPTIIDPDNVLSTLKLQ